MNRSRLQQNRSKHEGPPTKAPAYNTQSPHDPSYLEGTPVGAIKGVNFQFFLWPYIVGMLFYFSGLSLTSIGVHNMNLDLILIGGWLQLPALISLIFAGVFSCIIIYRAWAAIQDGITLITPGKALGLLFVPFFNLYWIFRVFPGWASNYNRHLAHAKVERHDKRATEGIFITQAILTVSGFALSVFYAILAGIAIASPSILVHYFWVPILVVVAHIGLIPMALICMYQMCRGTVYLSSGN